MKRRSVRLHLEPLEDRVMPTGSDSTPDGFTPAQIRNAYGFNELSADGTGQTIADRGIRNCPRAFISRCKNLHGLARLEFHRDFDDLGLPVFS